MQISKKRIEARTQLTAAAARLERIEQRIRSCSYGELEALAGVEDRNSFWAPFGEDEAAARKELTRRARAHLLGEAA